MSCIINKTGIPDFICSFSLSLAPSLPRPFVFKRHTYLTVNEVLLGLSH